MKVLTKVALGLFALGGASPASAAPLLFSLTATDPARSLTFTLDSNPTKTSFSSTQFTLYNVAVSKGAGIVNSSVSFFTLPAGGGFSATGDNISFNGLGEQLFSGTTRAPQFTAGTFSLEGLSGTWGGTLTISAAVAAVPEPATWAMMMVGFGLVAGAVRYRRKTFKASFG